jgi:hypothetical protein
MNKHTDRITIDGKVIFPDKIVCYERKERWCYDDIIGDSRITPGVLVHFIGNGKLWLEGSDAKAFEQAINDYDSRGSELPY